jgi:hypothetical protein
MTLKPVWLLDIPKARALLVVTHADDETIFAGGLILSSQNTAWTIICVHPQSQKAIGCVLYNSNILLTNHISKMGEPMASKPFDEWYEEGLRNNKIQNIQEELKHCKQLLEIFRHSTSLKPMYIEHLLEELESEDIKADEQIVDDALYYLVCEMANFCPIFAMKYPPNSSINSMRNHPVISTNPGITVPSRASTYCQS